MAIETNNKYSDRDPGPAEIAELIQSSIWRIFPAALVSNDGENIGFGFGNGYKNLVFVVSAYREHVNLGSGHGATLADPQGLMQGSGKVHRHVKLQSVEQISDPAPEELMVRALRVARKRADGSA